MVDKKSGGRRFLKISCGAPSSRGYIQWEKIASGVFYCHLSKNDKGNSAFSIRESLAKRVKKELYRILDMRTRARKKCAHAHAKIIA